MGYRNRDNREITDPAATDGRKVVLQDTDHLGAHHLADDAGHSRAWVWKTFTRGYNPILMEMHQTNPMGDLRAGFVAARQAMGHTLMYADKMNLAMMMPGNDLASTGYCLANPGNEYLIYQPESGEFSVKLLEGAYFLEWFDPRTGKITKSDNAAIHGGKCFFRTPFGGDAVLHILARLDRCL